MLDPFSWNTLAGVGQYGALLPPRTWNKEPLVGSAITVAQNVDDATTITTATWDPHTTLITCDNNAYSVAVVDCTALDIAYDQINRLNAMWIQGDTLYLYWYDALIASFVTSNFGEVTQAFLLMDDVRHYQQAHSTLMLVYSRAGTIYYRLQADRFSVEYTVGTMQANGVIRNIGMNVYYRLQIAIGGLDYGDLTEQLICVDDTYVMWDTYYLGSNVQ